MRKLFSWSFLSITVGILLLSSVFFTTTIQAQGPQPRPTVDPDAIASPAQVAAAMADWLQSKHADTYDDGMGADTTCARCKSPLNWNPTALAAEAAMDCASCKRVPGEERPVLEGGEPIAESEWHNIGCEVCHEPVGNSYRIEPVFWNQPLGEYEPVESAEDLCAHCHEGQHGFEVTEEVHADSAHPGWGCLDCHEPHGDDISCEDCHDVLAGEGAMEHLNHQQVRCSACHDQGGLALWTERDPASPFYGEVITIRFAHTLTSWPSHNLQTEVSCGECHHTRNLTRPSIAQTVSCDNAACHPGGAGLYWCAIYEQQNIDR